MTTETEKFNKQWKEHLQDFNRLKITLHPSDWNKLEDAMISLAKVIELATKEKEKWELWNWNVKDATTNGTPEQMKNQSLAHVVKATDGQHH